MREETFFIGGLADRTGVPPDTIRYYEDEGVLPRPERSEAGYRLYDESSVERLRFVCQAQTLGLQLDEIAEILALVEERGVDPCPHVEAKLRQRLAQLRERMRELEALEERLRAAIVRARAAPENEDCRCRIIEGVEGEERIEIGRVGTPRAPAADDVQGREGP